MLTVVRLIVKANGTSLYGDAALTLQIHVVKNLVGHYTFFHGTAKLDKSVRKG